MRFFYVEIPFRITEGSHKTLNSIKHDQLAGSSLVCVFGSLLLFFLGGAATDILVAEQSSFISSFSTFTNQTSRQFNIGAVSYAMFT